MKEIYPEYYKSFCCLADKCPDTCCRNWEIDIDHESAEIYRTYTGPLKSRLSSEISYDNTPHFILRENGNCPFLNENGLCDIYAEMGKDALCDICREHPRYYYEADSIRFCGVGLACPEAAKLILSDDNSDALNQSPEFSCEPLKTIWENYSELSGNASRCADRIIFSKIVSPGGVENICDKMLSHEILKPLWRETLLKIKSKAKTLLDKRAEFYEKYPEIHIQCERLMRYFLFRHIMKAELFDDVIYGINEEYGFALISVLIILLCDVLKYDETGCFDFGNQVDICKLYSQEIEYTEEMI